MSEEKSEHESKSAEEPAAPATKKRARKTTRKRVTTPKEVASEDGAKPAAKKAAKKTARKTVRKKVAAAQKGEPAESKGEQSVPQEFDFGEKSAAKPAAKPSEPSSPAKPVAEAKPDAVKKDDSAGSASSRQSESRGNTESRGGSGREGSSNGGRSGGDSDRRNQRGGDSRRSGNHHHEGGGRSNQNHNNGGNPNQNRNSQNQNQNRKKKKRKGGRFEKGHGGGGPRRNTPFSAGGVPVEIDPHLEIGQLIDDELLQEVAALNESFDKLYDISTPAVRFNDLYDLPLQELRERSRRLELNTENAPSRPVILNQLLKHFEEKSNPILVEGCLEILDDGFGMVVFAQDSYRLKPLCPFVSSGLIEHHGLQRGHMVEVLVQAPREGETCPIALKVKSVMGEDVAELEKITPFTELTPYYPLDRILLENSDENPENNLSMRVVDLISPIGFGQRGLIVAPPRTGKTVLLQGIAHSIQMNYPKSHLIVLLIDERPEEVTDFRRRVNGEVISSTFDETAGSHVHAAEMVIEKSRRLVETGRDVVILLDSITRLARAYNTLMPSSGKILSGGVEANALQKPKRFFGSARNIEGGGSLTIMGTALVDTGSKMDEVIFEEFKGTGNMELHLDRALVDKRIFPALAMDRSGTRKEELLYHPDEMQKVYSLRRATKGVPPVEAMEMLIQRVKKTRSNAEFLMTLSR
tara:strand:- start:12430 stop:14514 length:2085 start_codon:yes stop_codon:yes gene_type:complete